MDLISRQAAIEAMRKAKDKSEAHRMLMQLPSAQLDVPGTYVGNMVSKEAVLDEIHKYMEEPDYTIGLLHDRVCEMPPAQPERKKGHWIEVNDNYNRISGRCSVCGWESHMYEDDVVGMDFCPNCGARLDEKGGEVWSK